MNLSQKCLYALRALFELARRQGQGPIRIAVIAESQRIPPRFLEVILGELKHAGYVVSRRGARGGYTLAVAPEKLSVGDVIRFVDGSLGPVKSPVEKDANGSLAGGEAFTAVWRRAKLAVEGVFDAATMQTLVDEDKTARNIVDFSI